MFRLGTAFLVLVAVSIAAPAPAQPIPCENEGEVCDDGNPCTAESTCKGGGVCTGPVIGGCVLCTDGACDDGNPCTDDTCTGGVCSFTPNDLNVCTDGNQCTVGDTCQGGTCVPGAPDPCTPPDGCHAAGTCDPATGCSNPEIPGCVLCTDGTCDDGNPCTDDTCTGGVCSFTIDDTNGCTDGNQCTVGDTCQGGTCTPGTAKTCMALDQCHTAGTCDPQTGACSNPPAHDTPCDDGDGCTVGDTCQSGTCTAGPPMNCDDGKGCTADSCSAGACVNEPQSGCIPCGVGLPLCDDGNVCTTDTCVTGKCQFANNTLLCDDGDACTTASACKNGDCVGTADVVCQPNDQCLQAGTCDPATGTCGDGPPVADDTPCDDADACTLDDACQAGTCTGGPTRDCDDGVPCTDDRCAAGQCVNDPLDARCTAGDCLAGRCDPGDPDADAAGCTVGPAPEGTACSDDGIACTEDVCTASGCEHLPTDDRCTPADECAIAVCLPEDDDADTAGCVSVPGPDQGAECAEDGDPCTTDACAAGVCGHEPAGEPSSCRPVEGPFRRARALLDFTRGLETLVSSVVTPDEVGGTGNRSLLMERLELAETDLELVVRILSGRVAVTPPRPLGTGPQPVGMEPTIAQQRGKLAFAQAKRTPAKVRAFLSVLALAKRRSEVSAAIARDLRRRGRSLLAGTKAMKRDLKRLQRVNQVFAR